MESAPGALPRIAIIDHYDSYTRNFLSLLTACVSLPVTDKLLADRVVVIPHTHPALKPEYFHRHLLPHLDALILSPGPGKPTEEVDFGTSASLLRHAELVQMPVLGVCLGHQGMATSFGAAIKCLPEPVHGIRRKLTMVADEFGRQRPYGARNILEGLPDGTGVICYNSLAVDEASLPPEIRVTAWSMETSEPRIIQALEHERLPYFGVQFHPESVESSGGDKILDNFLYNVHAYWNDIDPSRPDMWRQESCKLPQWIHELGGACMSQGAGPTMDAKMTQPPLRWKIKEHNFSLPKSKSLEATLAQDVPQIVERLFRKPKSHGGCFWLDSASAKDVQSHYSFMGTCDFTLSYNVARELYACVGPLQEGLPQVARIKMHHQTGFWDWMDALQSALQERTLIERSQTLAPDGSCRFRTGFVGFWSYEMKDESLGLEMRTEKHYEHSAGNTPFDRLALPLSEWGFCNKVLMLNHLTGTWTAFVLEKLSDERAPSTHPLDALEHALHGLHSADTNFGIGLSSVEADEWIAQVQSALEETCSTPESRSPTTKLQNQALPPLNALDSKETYMGKVQRAREFIRAGESYELCLTTQFEGSVPSLSTGQYDECFELYQKLRQKNPAPFGAYLELTRSTSGQMQAVLSTSPERFLTVDQDKRCEMRPIKGTVVRPGWGHGEREWIEKAKNDERMRRFLQEEDERRKLKLCQDKKECAENLMIADLIRADLQSVCFPTSVQVPRLIAIETYETVHQLVTSVTGRLRPGIKCVETIKRCFPPGSMTGAPKRRSTELLEQLEYTPGSSSKLTRRRGVYSGALGFIGVDGASNLSVAIRTATVQGERVTVGAGGAVTYLSTPEGEWAEVLHKLGSVATLASDV